MVDGTLDAPRARLRTGVEISGRVIVVIDSYLLVQDSTEPSPQRSQPLLSTWDASTGLAPDTTIYSTSDVPRPQHAFASAMGLTSDDRHVVRVSLYLPLSTVASQLALA
jgi:hypothetical protein